MLNRIKRLLLLTEDDLNSPSVPRLRQSALRIILTSGMLLVLGIILHSSWRAYQLGFTHVIVITISFYCAVLLALLLSARFQLLSSIILLFTVFAAGSCILFFVPEAELAKLGIFFVYTAPLISLMFFPRWVTFGVITLNFIPFLLLLSRYQPAPFLSFSISLPQTYEYLHSLLFLFFNLCIPLATLRIFSTFERNANSLKQLNQQISRSNQLYEEMFENTNVATLLVNEEGEVLKLNSKAGRLLGVEQGAVVHLASLLAPVSGTEVNNTEPFWRVQHIECQRQHGAGSAVLLSQVGQTESGHLLLQLEDLSELRALHQRLEHKEQERKIWQAYDLLTQLPNLSLFSRMTQRRLKQAEQGIMIIIRLCNVKSFNQQHGYNAGDELLKQFAQRTREILTNAVQLGRLRGVKFIAWSPVPLQAESPQAFAANLLAQLPEQLAVGQQLVRLSYELGVTTTGSLTEIEHYIEQCESALEFAEHYRQPIAFYTAAAIAEREAENQLLVDLKQALQQQQLKLWLQPKTSAQGSVESFEALLRWEKQPGQFIAPDRIIMLAEKYGLLVQLSRFVLNYALRLLKRWHEHDVPFPLSINLAGPDIMDAVFFSELVSLATHQPWLVDKLEIELTETSIISQQQQMFEKLTVLKKLGFRIAIDDFGTGQASLSLLAKLPASTLKLDRSFLTGFPHDRLQLKVLQATIQLAKSLNLKLIVEGVETEVQRKFLQRLGCEFMQGYLFSKPCSVEYWHAHRVFSPYFGAKNTMQNATAVPTKQQSVRQLA